MKFLANENIPLPSVKILRGKGFEVYSIIEEKPGIKDSEVLEIAIKNNLIILTLDRDYGEIIFRFAASNPPSVIYFRDKSNNPLFVGNMLLQLLEQGVSLENQFTVVDKDNIRQRKY
jgi:predicted nuclease of predicted toxin-antitoxin system